MNRHNDPEHEDFNPLRASWLSRHSSDLMQVGFFLLTFAMAVGTTYLAVRMQIQALELGVAQHTKEIAELRSDGSAAGHAQAATHEDVRLLAQQVADMEKRLLDRFDYYRPTEGTPQLRSTMENPNEKAAAVLLFPAVQSGVRGRGAANIRTGDR